jgi:hypothetical protein
MEASLEESVRRIIVESGKVSLIFCKAGVDKIKSPRPADLKIRILFIFTH